MGKMKDALVKLAKKVTGKELKKDEKDSMSNVINFMADNYEGGSGGSISGSYCFPSTLISREYLGFVDGSIDIDKLIEHLEASGVDLDEIVIREEETNYTINIMCDSLNKSYSLDPNPKAIIVDSFLQIQINNDLLNLGHWSGSIQVLYGGTIASFSDLVPEQDMSLKDVLLVLKANMETSGTALSLDPIYNMNHGGEYPNHIILTNEIIAYRTAIDEYQFFNIKNVDKFVKEVIIPYGSGSGSGSGDEPLTQAEI